MKKFLTLLAVTAMVLGTTWTLAMANGSSLPKADAKDVYAYLTQDNDYQTWPLFPGTEKLYTGQSPHGALLTTYVSQDVKQAIETGKEKLPDGAFIVKENYMPDGNLDAVTVMYRIKGYNSEAGDWFWAKYGAEGNIDASGKVAGCIGCHASASDNDWVLVAPIK